MSSSEPTAAKGLTDEQAREVDAAIGEHLGEPAALSHLWAELPNGRWQLRASDDFWYQLDPSGDVILSPLGIRQHTVSGDRDSRLRSVERIYREALERKVRHAQRDEMEARAALAALTPRTVST